MLHLTIITQEKELVSAEVDSITAMTTSGEVTILPGHIPLMTKLSDTEFVYRIKGTEYSLAVSGGFMNVEPNNKVIVLADSAIRSEDINEALAEEARMKAISSKKEVRNMTLTRCSVGAGNSFL
jgi:F-type H+-transporting ATPase subunit epsilon